MTGVQTCALPIFKAGVVDNASAITLMHAKTSVIKRPILEKDGKIIAIGFIENIYAEKLKAI